jgi:uncharacterized protein (DUF1501 family)
MMLSRRTALVGLASAAAFGRASLAVTQAESRKRFVVVILRGALDGLSAVTPYGDANLRGLRAPLLLPEPGQKGGLLDLGGFWGLHPAMSNIHAWYDVGQALPVHAVAGPDRTRSHFEAQDTLECGAEHRMDSGWLNRLAVVLPSAGPSDNAVALGQSVPLLLRGPARTSSWARDVIPVPSADFYSRLKEIHAHDTLTGPNLADGLRERGFSAHALEGFPNAGSEPPFIVLARAGGRLLATADGPRLAALELDGWDTHSGQTFRLAHAFAMLDTGLGALREELDAAWSDTVVLVITEFGRTARVNGTGGTDHGTATVAFVLGGRVAGGRVHADWPGLADDQLFEKRDLQPTLDIRSIAKGIAHAHFSLPAAEVDKIFPESEKVSSMPGLLQA